MIEFIMPKRLQGAGFRVGSIAKGEIYWVYKAIIRPLANPVT